MHLHRGFSDADIVGDLFVQTTGCDLDHDLTFAGAERVATQPERLQGFITVPTGAIASKPGFDGVNQLLITKRLGEKFYGAALHRLHSHRDIAVGCDEDNWQLPVARGKVALKFQTASAWHSHIEH
jgi:hypothetical protein